MAEQVTLHRTQREKDVEAYLTSRAEAMGGAALKIKLVAWVGFPDRLTILPKGRIGFIELKHPSGTGKFAEHQRHWQEKLRGWGCIAVMTNTTQGVDEFLASL